MPKSYLSHQDFLETVFIDSPSSILFHQSGVALHIGYERITDIGTLASACTEVPKYFPIDDESIILLNDPYCGGGVLSSFTLLMGVNISSVPKLGSEYLLGLKFHFRPKLNFADSVDSEGLKVPPTPIYDKKNKLNEIIVGAIENAPMAPENLRSQLEKAVDDLFKLRRRLLDCQKIWAIDLSQKAVQKYLNASHLKMVDFLTQIKPTSAHLKEQWLTGESLKLHIEKAESKLILEFTDAVESELYQLTKAATFGACFGAIQNILESKIPLNSGTLECVDVRVPHKSFLNVKQSSPVYLGFTEASGLIANLVVKVLSKINKDFKAAEGNLGCATIDLQFKTGQHFFDRLPSGQGANALQDGSSIVDKWTHHNLQASIEDIEKRFPLLIWSTSIRPGSGGNGHHSGGCGMIRSYSIEEAAQFHWFAPLKGHSPDGAKGGSSGLSTQFSLVRAHKKIRLEHQGSMSLQKGDRLDILTAGGGGFGDDSY